MRCLYCGIRLKITKEAEVIRHCPECSMRIECDGALEAFLSKAQGKHKAIETKMRVRQAAASSLLHH